MSRTAAELLEDARQLPVDQRILLANSLWESVDPGDDETVQIEAAWGEEIKRRLDEIDTGAVDLVPLEDVLARMDARILAKQRG
jgi:putative addiction module component (TIGR02574 family)